MHPFSLGTRLLFLSHSLANIHKQHINALHNTYSTYIHTDLHMHKIRARCVKCTREDAVSRTGIMPDATEVEAGRYRVHTGFTSAQLLVFHLGQRPPRHRLCLFGRGRCWQFSSGIGRLDRLTHVTFRYLNPLPQETEHCGRGETTWVQKRCNSTRKPNSR